MGVSVTVPACTGCCSLACGDWATIDIVFSGVGAGCNSCILVSGLALYLSGTANGLTGTITPTRTAPGSGRWQATVAGGYSYDLYNDDICTDYVSSGTADVEITVDCVDGAYTIRALALDIEGGGDNLDVFSDLTGRTFDATFTNTIDCGGTATLAS